VIDEQLAWDANGNLGSQTDGLNLSGGTRTMGCDGRDRLASAWVSGYGTESFVWDAFDRLRTRTSWGGGTDSDSCDGKHRLASINGPSGFRSYTHDARGNATGRPGSTQGFDAVNRLVQSKPVGGNVETYEYEGHGRRTGLGGRARRAAGR
jgi:YD repeat-containing protein